MASMTCFHRFLLSTVIFFSTAYPESNIWILLGCATDPMKISSHAGQFFSAIIAESNPLRMAYMGKAAKSSSASPNRRG